jgi:hypothetical protein
MPTTKTASAPTVEDLAATSAYGAWGDEIQREIDSIRELGRLADGAFADDEIYMYADFRLQHDTDLDKALKEREDRPEKWRQAKIKLAHELLMRAECKRDRQLQSGETHGFDPKKRYSDREFEDFKEMAIAKSDRGGLRA